MLEALVACSLLPVAMLLFGGVPADMNLGSHEGSPAPAAQLRLGRPRGKIEQSAWSSQTTLACTARRNLARRRSGGDPADVLLAGLEEARHHKQESGSTRGSSKLREAGVLANGRSRGGLRFGGDFGRAGNDWKTTATSAAEGAFPAAPAINAFWAAIFSAVSALVALARFRNGP